MTERRTQWSLENIVAEIQKLDAGGVTMTYAGMRAAGYGHVVTAAEKYAGTWSKAVKLAGVDAPVRFTWTAAKIVAEIRRLHAEGVELSSELLCNSGHAGVVTASRKFFDSWPAARAKAGIEWRRGTYKTWPDIRDALRKAHARGLKMSTTALNAAGLADLVAAARDRGGGWNAALRKAGIPLVMSYKHWTSKEVLQRIRARQAVGKSVIWGEVIADGERKLVKAAARHFGTWVAACQAALPKYQPLLTRWDQARVIDELRRRYDAGECMRSTEVAKDDQALYEAARRVGLSWRTACRRAAIPARALASPPSGPRTRWNELLILATLREAAARGLALTTNNFRGGFVQAVYRRFASWDGAMRAAGLMAPYRRDKRAARANRLSRPRPLIRSRSAR